MVNLKDLIGSVDWGKLWSHGDARNALIGTALGGAVLGGASLMQERDPEESKLAPVGDALTGALLGGVAGYGIPKGLELFSDAGSLAPDGDVLRHNYTRAAAKGGAAGTGLFGASLYRTLRRNAEELGSRAETRLPALREAAEQAVVDAKNSGARADYVAYLQRRAKMLDTRGSAGTAGDVLARLRRERWSAFFSGDLDRAGRIGEEIKILKRYRNLHVRGYRTVWGDLLAHAADEPAGGGFGKPRGLLSSLVFEPEARGNIWNAIRHPLTKQPAGPHFFTHGGHYATKNLLGVGRKIGPLGRAAFRGGKYAALGALLGVGIHALKGPSPSNNYKK